jgi:outer membrane receptor for ferric coprogen and ferric-rhodotorulic acid
MTPPTSIPGFRPFLLAAAVIATRLLSAQTQSAAPSPATGSNSGAPEVSQGIVELSPFQVTAESEHGYVATQTLNGTRLKTDLKDVGSAVTIFTEELMNDLGANSVSGLMAFAPNTDPFIATTTATDGNGNDFINIPTKYVTRGGATTVVAQDFFTNNIPQDRFNSEALTFTRGPNSILFGLGNAAGAFVSSTKRAKNKNAYSLEEQMDSRGGHRTTADINQVLIKNYLSLRYNGLFEGLNSYRINDNPYQRRQFITANFTPFKKTTLRVNYEGGHLQASAVRPWPDYDAVSPWLAAGSPLIPIFNAAAGKPTGTANYTFAGLISTELSPGGTPVPTMRMTGQGQSAPTSYANGYAVLGAGGTSTAGFRSLANNSIYPTLASSFADTAYRLTDYHIVSAFLEQQITRDFFIELGANKVNSHLVALNGFVGQQDYIYVDPNSQLPNGQANPNVGKLYSEAAPTRIDAPNKATNYRMMASYDLNLTRQTTSWLRYLGRHQAALFIEQDDSSGWSSNNSLFNVTPLPATIALVPAAVAITNANNGLRYRTYFDPAANKVSTSLGRHLEALPDLYANDPLPAPGPGGVTPAFLSQQGINMSEALVKTRALALQSFFWKDRIVVTNGLRQDNQSSWQAVPVDFAALRDANGIAPKPTGIDVRKFRPSSRADRGGHTKSHGVVFHAFPWLSLTYNTSNNFQVNSATRNVFGDLLPNPQGEGKDYGMKFALFDRRVFFDVTYYTNSSVNAADGTVSNGPAGNFKQFDQLWIAVGNYTGDTKYLTYPYSSLSTTWSDVVSTTSKGWELALTSNITKQWRLTINGSKRGNNTTSDRGTYIRGYMAQYIPIIQSHPEWQNLITAGTTTVSRSVADLQNILNNFDAIKSVPAANFASNWTLNMIQTYEFPREAKIASMPLGGFSIGGSMNARGKAIDGFAQDSTNTLIATAPFYAPSYTNFGAWITYKCKLFKNRVDWRLQMNVRNLFDDYTLTPLNTVDSRDGKHTPNVAIYTLREPRTYQFTSTFKF